MTINTGTVLRNPFRLDRVRRFVALKRDHVTKRLRKLRKPYMRILRPATWLARRYPAEKLSSLLAPKLLELQRTGFTLADVLIDPVRLEDAKVVVAGRLALGSPMPDAGRISRRKDFWANLLTAQDLRSDSALVHLALSPQVIELASAYLGETPHLSSVELVTSRATDGDRWKVSQLWHRDYNDDRMVKLFVYFSDVSCHEQGPFTFLPADAVRVGQDRMFPIHKSDETMRQIAYVGWHREVLGPLGTAFLIDTYRCYHCGSRILDGSYRVAFIATFTTFAAFYAYDNGIGLTGQESPIERSVLRP